MKSLYVSAAIAGLAMAASTASAQRMLQMDINVLDFQARNSAGAPAPFGGLTHTGSLVLSDGTGSVLNDLAIQTGGPGNPFMPQAFTGSLGDVAITINLNSGMVTGGSMMVHVGSDMYSATIAPGGSVTTYVGGGFKIDSLTSAGMFSGATFAGVNIADFFAAQGGGLPGSFLNFRIIPDANGAGTSDIDIFVSNVPTPGSLALLGMGGVLAARRRRR
jgi:MYXO-CTERM domain-containing protein